MDPTLLSRMAPEKREELKDMYHKMQKEQTNSLKIDVKPEDIVSPDQMLSSMTGCPVADGGGSGATQDPLGGSLQEQLEADP